MARVAVFSGPVLRRNLRAGAPGLSYTFFPPLGGRAPRTALDGFAGALVELGKGGAALPALRKVMDGRPVGSVSLKFDAASLRRSAQLGFDFHLGS